MNKNKSESRKEAASNRHLVFRLTNWRCALCNELHPYTLEAHHVDPVKNDGHGGVDNLVGLCPNCHSVVEKLKSNLIDDPNFHDWIRERYREDGYNLAAKIAGYTWGNE